MNEIYIFSYGKLKERLGPSDAHEISENTNTSIEEKLGARRQYH